MNPMLVLCVKILAPLLAYALSDYRPWSRQHSKRARAVAAVGVVASVIGLVVDHTTQAAAVAAAMDQAEADRQSLQRVEDSVDSLVAYMREREPWVTVVEAIDRVIEELRELHERSADLEEQLTGLRMYGEVARLDVLGLTGLGGKGLRETTEWSLALDGAWVERNGRLYPGCDQTALATFSAVTKSHPSFPVSHYALSECAFHAGDETWREHAERALEILKHTTQIAGNHDHHAEVARRLRNRLEQQQ